MLCCERGLVDEAKTIVKSSADKIHARSKQGWSPIIIAAYNVQGAVVRMLLECGANINDTGIKGTSVFMYAKTRFMYQQVTDFEFLQYLIENGALINHTDEDNQMVLDYVSETSSKALYHFLVTNGAQKSLKNE